MNLAPTYVLLGNFGCLDTKKESFRFGLDHDLRLPKIEKFLNKFMIQESLNMLLSFEFDCLPSYILHKNCQTVSGFWNFFALQKSILRTLNVMIMEFSVKWIIDSIQTIRPCLIGRTKNEHVQSHSMIQSPTGLTAKGSIINYHHILQDILSTLCLFSCCPTESPLIIAFEGGNSDDHGCIISFYVYSGELNRPL